MQKKSNLLTNVVLCELSGQYTARGCEALFYRLGTSKYGVKIYKSLETAFESYGRQKKAFKFGIAPEPKRFVMARKKGKKTIYYGYETEKAEEINFLNKKHKQIYNNEASNLFSQLKAIGLSGDFGDVNCGILRGKLVAVDFGTHSDSQKKKE